MWDFVRGRVEVRALRGPHVSARVCVCVGTRVRVCACVCISVSVCVRVCPGASKRVGAGALGNPYVGSPSRDLRADRALDSRMGAGGPDLASWTPPRASA